MGMLDLGPRVLALHCSGANGRQWRDLATSLAPDIPVATPDFYGCESRGPWPGDRPFTLLEEARPLLPAFDREPGRSVLVGHSYGGGVALRIALERRERLAGLVLYEPSAFHLLQDGNAEERAAFKEIRAVARSTAEALGEGDYKRAATGFVTYWGGPGAWRSMGPDLQGKLIRWAPKAQLDFHALISETTPAETYRSLDVPALILLGELAPAPTKMVANRLIGLLPNCRVETISGAGHMGAITHAAPVNALIRAHVLSTTLPPCSGRARRLPGISPTF